MKLFGMWRDGKRKADVVVLSSGKCIVAWPTSTIVYDSEKDARAVHITHMGGRGESTDFLPECSITLPPDEEEEVKEMADKLRMRLKLRSW